MLDFSKFKNRTIKCAGIGEVLFDVFENASTLGGAPANFAYHCKCCGLESVVISSVGKDKLGTKARNTLSSFFLPALLFTSDRPTGKVCVRLNSSGIPSYIFDEDTAYDNIPLSAEALDLVSKLDLICFGTLAQRSRLSHRTIIALLDAMQKTSIKVFDVNLRGRYFSKDVLDKSIQRSQIVKCNDDELPVLCEYAGLEKISPDIYAAYLKEQNIDCFVFTQGAVQSTVYLNGEKSVVKTPEVEVIDTVGAGDAFTAVLVSSLMKGFSLKEAHTLAVEYAAYICTRAGAMPDISSNMLERISTKKQIFPNSF